MNKLSKSNAGPTLVTKAQVFKLPSGWAWACQHGCIPKNVTGANLELAFKIAYSHMEKMHKGTEEKPVRYLRSRITVTPVVI